MKHCAGCLVLCLLLSLLGCGKVPPVAEQIRATIAEMETLAEEGQRGAFMEKVADQFSGQGGTLSREEFRNYLLLQWNRNQRIYAQLFTIEVQNQGPAHASAQFRALLTGGRGLIPERGQLYSITTTWVAQDDEWLLSSATWEPVDVSY